MVVVAAATVYRRNRCRNVRTPPRPHHVFLVHLLRTSNPNGLPLGMNLRGRAQRPDVARACACLQRLHGGWQLHTKRTSGYWLRETKQVVAGWNRVLLRSRSTTWVLTRLQADIMPGTCEFLGYFPFWYAQPNFFTKELSLLVDHVESTVRGNICCSLVQSTYSQLASMLWHAVSERLR